jgi:NADPH:quinone reductase-like Zn-dependent oxidoreductase
MKAMVTVGNGGYDKLVYRDAPVPDINDGEVLIEVLAAGINNTDINTRLGWYSSEVKTSTDDTQRENGLAAKSSSSGGWKGTTPFPLIQGTDCCGRVIRVAGPDPGDTVGKRVLVRSCIRQHGFESTQTVWFGSDFDGAFAQYTKAPIEEVFPVESEWGDADLGSIPCAYGTAENMLHRAQLRAGEHVLITGASGGVGSAAIQLAKRRGAKVTGIAADGKADQLRSLGADRIIGRDENCVETLGERSVDLVFDVVAGPIFEDLLRVLRAGARYVTAGAIGGPIVELDSRILYLKDLTLIGCTAWEKPVFPNLISYLQREELRPLVAATYPLDRMADAQREFLKKQHVGKIVVMPPRA